MTSRKRLRKRIKHLEWELFQARWNAEPATFTNVDVRLGDTGGPTSTIRVPIVPGQRKVVDLPSMGFVVTREDPT